MVKTLLSLLISTLLLFGAAIGESYFVNRQFGRLDTALAALEEKVREENATRTDAETVQTLWNEEKRKLHAVIPHNDISYIDYWLGGAVSYIETKNYDDALSKVEVLITVCKQIPKTYSISFENVF
mgnify:FL=1